MNKTIQTHIDRVIKTRKFSKSEIGALTKIMQSYRFASAERKNEIEHLQTETMEHLTTVDLYRHGRHFEAEFQQFPVASKITADQTKLGKAWLKQYCFKVNGGLRKNIENVFSERCLDIIRNVSRFEFVGVLMVFDDSGCGRNLCNVLPIYRTYDRKGKYFDYAPIHWDKPVVMEGL